MNLREKKCVPCEGGVPPLGEAEIGTYLAELDVGWRVLENPVEKQVSDGVSKKISRELKFKNFKEAMEFVNKVAAIANEEDHHPDIHIFYNKVVLELWTHAIGGLSENDFIMAAKIDTLINI